VSSAKIKWLTLSTAPDIARALKIEWNIKKPLVTASVALESRATSDGQSFVTQANTSIRLPIKKEMNYVGEAQASSDDRISFSSIIEKPSVESLPREWKAEGGSIFKKVDGAWTKIASVEERKVTTHSVFHILEAFRQTFEADILEYRAFCFVGSKFAAIKLAKINEDKMGASFHGFVLRSPEPFLSKDWPSFHWDKAELFECRVSHSDSLIESVSFAVPLFGLVTAQRSIG
jgi:hypothetical protein